MLAGLFLFLQSFFGLFATCVRGEKGRLIGRLLLRLYNLGVLVTMAMVVVMLVATAVWLVAFSSDIDAVRPPQHGCRLTSNTMALITSDCDAMRSRSIKWT